jgi:hypothetical protein
VQLAPSVQATQVPPLHTRLLPQLAPFACSPPVSTQWDRPPLEVIAPE